MWIRTAVAITLALAAACEAPDEISDAAGAPDGGPPPREDAGLERALPDAGTATPDAATDAGPAAPPLDAFDAQRRRLLDTLPAAACDAWASFDESQRQVFLTLTHRMHLSRTPDGGSMLSHLTRVYLVLGGGADGSACGDAENNRLFLSMDAYLWERMVEAWDGASTISDGGGLQWIHTRDLAGPHDPFDASAESDSGLRCRAFVVEAPDSRPPTAQAHFFRDGSAAPVERGPGISLPADPFMLEIDHDFDCFHQSNPTCRDFADRYRTSYGAYGAAWSPRGC